MPTKLGIIDDACPFSPEEKWGDLKVGRTGPSIPFDFDRHPIKVAAALELHHHFEPQKTNGTCAACGQQRGHELHIKEERRG